MVDLIRETPVDLKSVAHKFGVTTKTIYEWMKGVDGRRLETVKVGGKRFTTLEAVQRFSRPDSTQQSAKAVAEQKRIDEARKVLAEFGL